MNPALTQRFRILALTATLRALPTGLQGEV